MAKKFNITGTCIPTKHYMADTSGKLKQVMALVEQGEYFIINRPRQYGKTTTLFTIARILRQSENYLVFSTSFEGVGDKVFEQEQDFVKMFLRLLRRELNPNESPLAEFLNDVTPKINSLEELSEAITHLARMTPKKLVLLIDEVDKSSNNQLFVSFLAMLRNKYLKAPEGIAPTFHSIVLAGVHDVKTLKLKLRPDAEQKFNSPWNIATPFEVDMNLHPHEILPMLEEYAADRGVKMDAPAIAERLFYFTSGYPFLVSNLCKILDEKILPQKQEASWTAEDLEAAVNRLLKESNTNFDSLIIHLENYPELYDTVFRVALQGEQMDFNPDNPVVQLGTTHGIFARSPTGSIAIHNRVYRERILNYMVSKLQTSAGSQAGRKLDAYNYQEQFALPGNRLNMELALLRFQAFMKEQFSEQDRDFLERNGRLILLAFMKPIINGKGWDFKEPQIDEEKRMDVAVTYFQHKYVVELKIWRGEAAHKKGLKQLAGYLDGQGLQEGYLVVFDHSKEKSWRQGWVEVEGKRVFGVWV